MESADLFRDEAWKGRGAGRNQDRANRREKAAIKPNKPSLLPSDWLGDTAPDPDRNVFYTTDGPLLRPELPERKRVDLYLNAAGEAIFAEARYGDGHLKTYRTAHRVRGVTDAGESYTAWAHGDGPCRLVPLNLPNILVADFALVVEGPKCVQALADIGFDGVTPVTPDGFKIAATTSAHGAKAPTKTDWTAVAKVRGKGVMIIADADEPGELYARLVATILTELGATARIASIREFWKSDSPVAEGDDVVDWLERGGPEGWDPEQFRDHLIEVFRGTPNFVPESEPTPDGTSTELRPRVAISTDESRVINRCLEADVIGTDTNVFVRGAELVEVIDQTDPPSGRIEHAIGTPRIRLMTVDSMRDRLTAVARFEAERDNDWKPCHPPVWLVRGILARGQYPNVRRLVSITETPTIRPDGSILQTPGFDSQTGILYRPKIKFPGVPESPTKLEAIAASERLHAIVIDFPFAYERGWIGWLAFVITVLVRQAIEGPVPLFLFTAGTSGSGKTKLCQVTAMLAFGREAPCAALPEDDAEVQKTLLAIAIEGDRLVVFDNVGEGKAVGSPALDRAITAGIVKGRLLGQSRTVEAPWNAVVAATGNNLRIEGDALRRIVPIHLESPEVRPEERRDFKIAGDLLGYVREHRAELVIDVLTILRAFILAKRPKCDIAAMDFVAWSELVRGACYFATEFDPCEGRKQLQENDPKLGEVETLVNGLAMACNDTGQKEITARALLAHISPRPVDGGKPYSDPRFDDLRDELRGRDGALPSAKSLGHRLRKFRGKMTRVGAIQSEKYQGTEQWSVKPTKATETTT